MSIGQDVCRAVLNGEWKLGKHILLTSTIRHLFRSKQLTTILNRLGHCESYHFGEELETAIAKAIDENQEYITPEILGAEHNLVFHSEWDNLNKVLTNVTGSNIVNSAGGIMLQEVSESSTPASKKLPKSSRDKTRTIEPSIRILPPLEIYKRVGPRFPAEASITPPVENDLALNLAQQE